MQGGVKGSLCSFFCSLQVFERIKVIRILFTTLQELSSSWYYLAPLRLKQTASHQTLKQTDHPERRPPLRVGTYRTLGTNGAFDPSFEVDGVPHPSAASPGPVIFFRFWARLGDFFFFSARVGGLGLPFKTFVFFLTDR